MKTKGYIGVIIIFAVFILFAFVAVPAARMMGIELPFIKETDPDSVLELTVDYSAYGDFFEIGKDIEVYTDPELTVRLRMIRCVPNEPYEGRYKYSFELPAEVNAVWITPPLLYIPNEIEAVSCGAAAGSAAKRPDGQIWFTVGECRAAKATDGLYTVSIIIDAVASDLPRSPRLLAGGQELGGTSALNFDGDGVFTSGEFQFSIKAKDEDDAVRIAEKSTSMISEELKAQEVDDLRIVRIGTTGEDQFEVNLVDPARSSEPLYSACSYIVARDGHYNIGVEVHCRGRSPAGSLMFNASEFGDLVTELPDDPDDGRNYCEAIPGANTMKEWITVSIEDKDLDKVISQLKKHVFEIDLVDPEGNYEEIHEKTRLKLVKAL
jgi:hypothetical protein